MVSLLAYRLWLFFPLEHSLIFGPAHGDSEGKGVLNNRISEHILLNLSQIGIENHLVKRLNMREQIIKLVEIIPIEFIVRNVATGSIVKRLGIEDGTVLNQPLLEYCLKNDELGDPLIAEEHILAFEWATKKEIEKVKKMILRINDFMVGMFRGVGIKLIDFKLEFGRLKSNGKTNSLAPTSNIPTFPYLDDLEIIYSKLYPYVE